MKVNIHTHHPYKDELTLTTVGIHPWSAESFTTDTALIVEQQAALCDAVGEIGLDYACNVEREAQTLAFKVQLEIAQKANKGVVLHCVKAFEPMMDILQGYTLPFVIFHGFIGSAEQAARAVAKGYYLSFGERTFRSPKTIEAMRTVPPERLFLETDESDTPITEIYSRAAAVLGVPEAILEDIISENYCRICG